MRHKQHMKHRCQGSPNTYKIVRIQTSGTQHGTVMSCHKTRLEKNAYTRPWKMHIDMYSFKTLRHPHFFLKTKLSIIWNVGWCLCKCIWESIRFPQESHSSCCHPQTSEWPIYCKLCTSSKHSPLIYCLENNSGVDLDKHTHTSLFLLDEQHTVPHKFLPLYSHCLLHQFWLCRVGCFSVSVTCCLKYGPPSQFH